MTPTIQVFDNATHCIESLADEFAKMTRKAALLDRRFHLALSGGRTPETLYKQLAARSLQESISWGKVHLYWGDERCVSPDDIESNYGMTKRTLIDHVDIPAENIHRIYGEAEICQELSRYSNEIIACLPTHENAFPQFDWILLGVGTDGHTASLFPNSPALLESTRICTWAESPQTGQKRITLTLPVINTAKQVSFLVTGEEKATIVSHILNGRDDSDQYPAAKVTPVSQRLDWYLDRAAACKL